MGDFGPPSQRGDTMTVDKDMARRFQQAKDERAYWERHYPSLVIQFPDEWIAVHKGVAVAHAPRVWNLLQMLESEGIDPLDAWITFLNATHRAISL